MQTCDGEKFAKQLKTKFPPATQTKTRTSICFQKVWGKKKQTNKSKHRAAKEVP